MPPGDAIVGQSTSFPKLSCLHSRSPCQSSRTCTSRPATMASRTSWVVTRAWGLALGGAARLPERRRHFLARARSLLPIMMWVNMLYLLWGIAVFSDLQRSKFPRYRAGDGYECRHGLISKIPRNLLHCCPRCKASDCDNHLQLLSPAAKGQARLVLNETGVRILTHRHSFCPLRHRTAVGRIVCQLLCNACKPGLIRQRKMKMLVRRAQHFPDRMMSRGSSPCSIEVSRGPFRLFDQRQYRGSYLNCFGGERAGSRAVTP